MVLRLVPYQIASYGLSDTGLVRKNNEDVWGSLPQHHLFVVADGMGGHQAGEVASRETNLFLLTYLRQAFEKEKVELMSVEEVEELMRLGFIEVNQFIYELSRTHELLRGMGTTLVSVYFHEDMCVIGHVGDSRVYRLRNGVLEQLTEDHSHVSDDSDKETLSSWRRGDFGPKKMITRAIGTEVLLEPTFFVAHVLPNDLYLLCSDGLTDLVDNNEIGQLLKARLTVEEKVRSLISSAKRKGGHDNITCVCIEVHEKDISR